MLCTYFTLIRKIQAQYIYFIAYLWLKTPTKQLIRIMKLVLFLTFVVALTFVIDGSQMVQAEGEDDDPVLDSFKHCRKLCHSLQTFVSYFSKRFKDGKGYAACFATCELQLEEAKSKRHPYLYSCQLVLNLFGILSEKLH